jgi:hypothetical protein
MAYIPLIDTATGEILDTEIVKRAPLRAAREWGGENYPPKYLRAALDWLRNRAEMERLQWRQERGLREERTVILMNLPRWGGSSGDSFAKDR